jgi:class 3 adenylate cyclase
MATLNEALLDEQLAELEKLRTWSPRLISKLETFLRTDDEWALFRANPFCFAEERGVSEEEAIDLFLLAAKVGVFQMSWNLLCPGCGDAVQSFASLKSVCSVFHCFLCGLDMETRLDEFVHIGFTISPRIRSIRAHNPAALSMEDFLFRYHFSREARVAPGGPRFSELAPQWVLGHSYLEPRGKASFTVQIEPGAIAVYDMISSAQFLILVDPSQAGPNSPQRLRLQDGKSDTAPIVLAPGTVEIEIENDSDERNSILLFFKPQEVVDQMAAGVARGEPMTLHFDKFLSGRKLLTSDTFRHAFSAETIRRDDGIGVRDISILFTDLKGSTEMYERIGDLRAFALVNQHFECLGRAIARYRGAVVKTIGDAVMASFETPADAVLAAREMLTEIERFNAQEGEREIVLKVGVHRGASIAVTLNERLDFFGQTVNIASRVQGLADADEIYITDEVYRAPGVKELISEFHVTPHEVSLRGVQRPVSVYRVATAPPSGA